MLLRLSPLVAALAAAGAVGCGGDPTTPMPDACATPSAGSIDSVEVGAATADDLVGRPSTFMPLHDGDGMTLIRGGQGANMLGFILHVAGASAPTCLAQHTLVTDPSGTRVATSTAPLSTYVQPDGTRLTHPLWLPATYPLTFTVAITAADKSVALQLHLNVPR